LGWLHVSHNCLKAPKPAKMADRQQAAEKTAREQLSSLASKFELDVKDGVVSLSSLPIEMPQDDVVA
jgi:hypothetical protein